MYKSEVMSKELEELYESNVQYHGFRDFLPGVRNTAELHIFDFNENDEDTKDQSQEQAVQKAARDYDKKMYDYIVNALNNTLLVEIVKNLRKVRQGNTISEDIIKSGKAYDVPEDTFIKIINKEKKLLNSAKQAAKKGKFLSATDIPARLKQLDNLPAPSPKPARKVVAKQKSPETKPSEPKKRSFVEMELPIKKDVSFDEVLLCDNVLEQTIAFIQKLDANESDKIKIHMQITTALKNLNFELYFGQTKFQEEIYKKNLVSYETSNRKDLDQLKTDLMENMNNQEKLLKIFETCCQLKSALQKYVPGLVTIAISSNSKNDNQLCASLLNAFHLLGHKKTKNNTENKEQKEEKQTPGLNS